MTAHLDWPTPAEEHHLLTQLTSGTPTAREAVAVRFLPLLMQFLTDRFARVAADLRDEAAGQALFDYLKSPNRFDPTRGGLSAYLRMAARGDLRNLLDAERRARRGIALDSVAEPVDHRNNVRDEGLTWDDPRLAAELNALAPDERAALALMSEGVRETAEFVEPLGLAHLTADEQVVAVKRVKDRVKRRLARAVEDV